MRGLLESENGPSWYCLDSKNQKLKPSHNYAEQRKDKRCCIAALFCMVALAVTGIVLLTMHWYIGHIQKEAGLSNQVLDIIQLAEMSGVDAVPAPKKFGSVCKSYFHLFSFADVELFFPHLAECALSTYAMVFQASALASPCRGIGNADAALLVFPPYLAQEENWPVYSRGLANTYRAGRVCRGEVLLAASELQKRHANKPVLLVDLRDGWDFPKWEYAVQGRMWAKVGMTSQFYRKNEDISLPPSPSLRCSEPPAEAYSKPLLEKKYFMSFKGLLSRIPVRQRVSDWFHNGRDIVIVDDEDSSWDFDALEHNSRFVLILGGHGIWSTRFAEAVCSGGVPVLVTEGWIPPFDEILPFVSYGVQVPERDAQHLLPILQALPVEEMERRRGAAKNACQTHFGTVRTIATHTLQLALAHIEHV